MSVALICFLSKRECVDEEDRRAIADVQKTGNRCRW